MGGVGQRRSAGLDGRRMPQRRATMANGFTITRTARFAPRVMRPPNGRPSSAAPIDLPSIGAFRLEQLTDPDLPCRGPGRSIKGMSALSEFNVEAADRR